MPGGLRGLGQPAWAAAAPLLAAAIAAAPEGAGPGAFDVRAFVWTRLTVANNSTGPYPIPPVAIDLPMNDTYQLARLVNVSVRLGGAPLSCPARVVYGDCGSPTLEVLCSGSMPPRSLLEVEVVSEVLVRRFRAPSLSASASGTLDEVPGELRPLTRSEGPWRYSERGMGYLAEEARRVAGGERRVLEVVARLVDWIWGKVEYEVGPGPRYPNETLPPQALREGRGRGDCDDQANLLILALRSLGVPAYLKVALVADFDYSEDRTIWVPQAHYYAAFVGVNYAHAWAEVYVPPWGWLPVDLTFHAGSGDPLDAIRTSATSDHWRWQQVVTVRVGSVCHEDYIAEFRRWLAEVSSTPLFYYWEHAVVREGDSIARVRGFLKPLPLPWVRATRIEVSYPSRARALTTLVVTGRLEPGLANASVILRAIKPSGGVVELEARTGAGGEWRAEVFLDEAGAWTFNATYPGSPGYAGCSREFTVYVEKLPSRLELRAEQAGGALVVRGALQPPVNATVTLLVEAPSGRRSVLEVATVGGRFTAEIPADEPGLYKLQAFWPGDRAREWASANASALFRAPTRLHVEAEAGERCVTVKGRLEPPVAGARIRVEARRGAASVSCEALTDANGSFAATLNLSEGEWELRVSFDGTELHQPSSASLRVEVPGSPRGPQLAAVLAAVAALAVAALRWRGRRQPRGGPPPPAGLEQ